MTGPAGDDEEPARGAREERAARAAGGGSGAEAGESSDGPAAAVLPPDPVVAPAPAAGSRAGARRRARVSSRRRPAPTGRRSPPSRFARLGLVPPAGSAPDPPSQFRTSTRLLVAVPYLFIAAVVAADLITSKDTTFTPMLPVVPALAALGRRTVRAVLIATSVAAVVLATMPLYNTDVPPDAYWAAAAALATVAVVSCVSINLLRQQSQVLADVRSVAEAAQHVVLRDIPADLDQVRTASAYEAAEAEARIGGDLYEGLATRYGDRFIIGDVRGKGLPAVEAAADVLGVFRDAAHTEPDLATVAVRLDAALSRRPVRDEEFVTAVLISVHPESGTVEIVNCGHPPPLLLRHGRVAALAPDVFAPPLGLFDLGAEVCEPYHARFLPGDTLLLYTDGTTEARDAAGRFFPLTQYLGGVRFDGPGELIELVRMGLRLHSGERLNDDVALVAVQRKEKVVLGFAEPEPRPGPDAGPEGGPESGPEGGPEPEGATDPAASEPASEVASEPASEVAPPAPAPKPAAGPAPQAGTQPAPAASSPHHRRRTRSRGADAGGRPRGSRTEPPKQQSPKTKNQSSKSGAPKP